MARRWITIAGTKMLVGLLPFVALSCANYFDTSISIVIAEKSLGSTPSGFALVSPNGKRVAFIRHVGQKEVAVIDGVEQQEYQTVVGLRFSPDSAHFAYLGVESGRWHVIRDGVEVDEWEDFVSPSTFSQESLRPTFSPDGERLAYSSQVGSVRRAIVDGVRGRGYSRIDGFTFSPDSGQLAYRADTGLGDQVIVVDEAEGGSYPRVSKPCFFSATGQVVYVAYRHDSQVVVLGGTEVGQYDAVQWPPVFSPDGERMAYAVRRGARMQFVIDGGEGPSFDKVGGLVFSADGNRFAYSARRGTDSMLVTDEDEVSGYDGVMVVAFSPDSRRLAYLAMRAGKVVVVVDGDEAGEWDQVRWLDFSPDSKHVAYAGNVGFEVVSKPTGPLDIEYGKWWVTVDGSRRGRAYRDITGVAFSPDGRHIVYWGQKSGKWVVVVDGEEMTGSFTFPLGSRFDRTFYQALDMPGLRRRSGVFMGGLEYEGSLRGTNIPPVHSSERDWVLQPRARFVFDSPSAFNSLAWRGDEALLVNGRIQTGVK